MCSQKGNAAEGTRGLAAGSAPWLRVLWQGWKCVAWWVQLVPSERNAGLERGPAGSETASFPTRGRSDSWLVSVRVCYRFHLCYLVSYWRQQILCSSDARSFAVQ